ncbi:MAG: hypothetical protein C0624_00170 [Desulfuromonas sp.]|nr:MAG: hypothetical protein C0624_00170 [Desulfuromonas sp.]
MVGHVFFEIFEVTHQNGEGFAAGGITGFHRESEREDQGFVGCTVGAANVYNLEGVPGWSKPIFP